MDGNIIGKTATCTPKYRVETNPPFTGTVVTVGVTGSTEDGLEFNLLLLLPDGTFKPGYAEWCKIVD